MWKNCTRVAEAVFDQHAMGVAGNETLHRGLVLIGQRIVGSSWPQIQDEDLPKPMPLQHDRLLIDFGGAVLARWHVQLTRRQAETGQRIDFLQQLGEATAPR